MEIVWGSATPSGPLQPEDKAIIMVVPEGFSLQDPRSPALDISLVKRGEVVRMGMGWFRGLVTRKSQKRTNNVHNYTCAS